jgi:hypothetical protein
MSRESALNAKWPTQIEEYLKLSRALKQLEERSYLTLLFQFGTAQAILLLLLLLSLEA